ncbi:MAG: hypothetical protein GF333_04860 [Candidatus Omnitrophica bacterium]|nr:hypothetical protein [Candidatus Omnitrophota bacterium]
MSAGVRLLTVLFLFSAGGCALCRLPGKTVDTVGKTVSTVGKIADMTGKAVTAAGTVAGKAAENPAVQGSVQ